jgi:hypothetical protein
MGNWDHYYILLGESLNSYKNEYTVVWSLWLLFIQKACL